jgi:hypothetical protein
VVLCVQYKLLQYAQLAFHVVVAIPTTDMNQTSLTAMHSTRASSHACFVCDVQSAEAIATAIRSSDFNPDLASDSDLAPNALLTLVCQAELWSLLQASQSISLDHE